MWALFSLWILKKKKTLYAKSEGHGSCVKDMRRNLCLKFSIWSLPEGTHQRKEKYCGAALINKACRGFRQCSGRLLTPKPSQSHSLILQRLESAEEGEKEAKEAEEMELLINMSLKLLTREQVIYRLKFGDYRYL